MNRSFAWRRGLGAATFVSCLGAATLVPGGEARADGIAYYEAVAKAVGAGYTLSNQSVPLGLVFEGIGPEADARQSSLQRADANASVPYFGDTIPGLPGTLGGIYKLPIPSYPLIASTSYGEAPVDIDFPGVSMHAESTASSTIARSSIGSAATGAAAAARVDETADGGVVSSSDSEFNALKLGNQITLSGVRSRAVTSADAAGKLTRTATLSIARIFAPGLALTLPENSTGEVPIPIPIPGVPNTPPIPVEPFPVPYGGQTIVAPEIGFVNGTFTIALPFAGDTQRYAVPAGPVIDAFKALGITLGYQSAEILPTGIAAPVLSMGFTFPSPPPNQYVQGETPVTFSIGQALALVDARTAGSANSTNGTASATDGGSAPTLPSSGNVPGVDQIAALFPSPVAPDQVGSVPVADVPVVQQALTVNGRASTVGADLSSIYFVLVVGGLLAFVATTALRLMGVRFRWGS
ncbi:hypothetical protein [Sporichthya sp.]|uniref:hypothetical protein n=1 Tax=Sporichthya sp. TaxID=65475 RepID=UPI00184B66B0|nr:hypothetical protein [Sporichthya sp.]MBA3741834.1 hypothetical protein [Sporichthya sp.]